MNDAPDKIQPQPDPLPPESEDLVEDAGHVRRCPHCGSVDTRVSWPRLHDWLFRILFRVPYRCRACYRRFYGRRIRSGGSVE